MYIGRDSQKVKVIEYSLLSTERTIQIFLPSQGPIPACSADVAHIPDGYFALFGDLYHVRFEPETWLQKEQSCDGGADSKLIEFREPRQFLALLLISRKIIEGVSRIIFI